MALICGLSGVPDPYAGFIAIGTWAVVLAAVAKGYDAHILHLVRFDAQQLMSQGVREITLTRCPKCRRDRIVDGACARCGTIATIAVTDAMRA